MNISFTASEPQEYEISFLIGGTYVVMLATISNVQAEADVWEERGNFPDYEVQWERATVAFAPLGQDEPIWEIDINRADLDVVKNLTDAEISDACDEIAEAAFHEQSREGVI